MARLTKKAINAFKGRQAEETVYGEDPAKLGPAFISSRENLMHAYNWYAQIGEVKNLRKWVEKYAATKPEKISPQTIEALKKVKDMYISMTMCAIAKMNMSGCGLPVSELTWLDSRINEVVAKLADGEPKAEKVEHETGNQLIADTDDMLDEFYRSGYKKEPVDYFKYLTEIEAKPLLVRLAISYYQELLNDLMNHRDDLKPKPKRAYQAFLVKILEDSEAFLSNSRKERALVKKPRKVKAKSADKVVKNVKYKASEPSLKITSVPPAGMHGALYIWLYNTKYKRLTYLESSEPMTVKGTTVIGFDEKASITKTLRKPEKTLSELMDASPAVMIKKFNALSTKPTSANGRLNSDTLILKAKK